MTIDFSKTNVGDKLRIVGAGAPGFAKVGDIVEVTECNGTNRCDVKRDDGETVFFALTCGAARLEPVEPDDTAAILANGPHDHDHVVKTIDVDNTDVVKTFCPVHETIFVDGLCKACGGKSDRNRRVSARWNELSALGKHGHYETLFQVVREEVEPLEMANEEMVRGMTEIAERATTRMDAAGAQIDRLHNSLLEMHACYMEAGSGEPLNKQQRHRHRMALMAARAVLENSEARANG